MQYHLTDPSGTTVIGGRITGTALPDHPAAPGTRHVREAVVNVPLFAEPPVIVVTCAGREDPLTKTDPAWQGNPGATVPVYSVVYQPDGPDQAIVAFTSTNTEPGLSIMSEGKDITLDFDYVVMGRLAPGATD
ncbi:MAG: hypothetical protein ACRC35_12040 [Angustibacter sp.]